MWVFPCDDWVFMFYRLGLQEFEPWGTSSFENVAVERGNVGTAEGNSPPCPHMPPAESGKKCGRDLGTFSSHIWMTRLCQVFRFIRTGLYIIFYNQISKNLNVIIIAVELKFTEEPILYFQRYVTQQLFEGCWKWSIKQTYKFPFFRI